MKLQMENQTFINKIPHATLQVEGKFIYAAAFRHKTYQGASQGHGNTLEIKH